MKLMKTLTPDIEHLLTGTKYIVLAENELLNLTHQLCVALVDRSHAPLSAITNTSSLKVNAYFTVTLS